MIPKLLDLFCGAGGCSVGYNRAGFECYGIDNDPKPLRHYPFPHICMDALEAMDTLLRGKGLTFSKGETLYLADFAAFHASPKWALPQKPPMPQKLGSCPKSHRLWGGYPIPIGFGFAHLVTPFTSTVTAARRVCSQNLLFQLWCEFTLWWKSSWHHIPLCLGGE